MYTLYGTLCLAGAAVLFAWGYAQIRRPDANAWADTDLFAQTISIVFVALLAFGIGFLARLLMVEGQAPLSWLDAGAIAGTVAASLVAVQLCVASLRRARARHNAGGGASVRLESPGAPSAANDPGSDSPSPPLAGGARGKVRQRRAA